MYFTPYNDTSEVAAKRGLSDTLVLLVTILLLVTSITFPLLRATAETRLTNDQLIISIADKDYSVLLSSLFGKVGKQVPTGAYDYTRDVDEYRARIAQGIKENNELTQILYILIKNFPKALADGYRQEIDERRIEAEKLKIAIFPLIESDAILSDAVVEKYELYTSLTAWVLRRINNKSVIGDLNKIQEQSYTLRKEIALLYMRIEAMTQNGR